MCVLSEGLELKGKAVGGRMVRQAREATTVARKDKICASQEAIAKKFAQWHFAHKFERKRGHSGSGDVCHSLNKPEDTLLERRPPGNPRHLSARSLTHSPPSPFPFRRQRCPSTPCLLSPNRWRGRRRRTTHSNICANLMTQIFRHADVSHIC